MSKSKMLALLVSIFSASILCATQEESNLRLSGDLLDHTEQNIQAFTGRINANRVRLRAQPTTDAQVVNEIDKGEFVLVTGEHDNFLKVLPPKDTKVYVYRTFVLDNPQDKTHVVEGLHVNVRLEPTLESPVLTQLNTGDIVTGVNNPDNGKWLAIDPPESVNFFVAKEYVENAGDANFFASISKRENEVNHLLNSAYLISQSELRKPYEEVNFDHMTQSFDRIINEYADFPEHVGKAKDALSRIQDTYLQKKVAFLEAKTENTSSSWKIRNATLNAQIQAYQQKLEDLEHQMDGARNRHNEKVQHFAFEVSDQTDQNFQKAFDAFNGNVEDVTDQMMVWKPVEESNFHLWAANAGTNDVNAYLQDQKRDSEELSGIIEPYYRPIKNKPGDYVLRNPHTSQPIAYLYSTKVNLQGMVGQEVRVKASKRSNNHFAFPAFHVWTIE